MAKVRNSFGGVVCRMTGVTGRADLVANTISKCSIDSFEHLTALPSVSPVLKRGEPNGRRRRTILVVFIPIAVVLIRTIPTV